MTFTRSLLSQTILRDSDHAVQDDLVSIINANNPHKMNKH